MKIYTMAVCLPGDAIPADVIICAGDSLTVTVHEKEIYSGVFTETATVKFAHMTVEEAA